ncbi:hypothetical protein ACFPES_28145 [Paenibacillus sp. GCM10023248]|uniref:hypothetical protein n=1 Tax=unclassified Paenibacillus TaxID=185978 RepID=UPI002378A533|nr:hypothetical protein [Paenibacillus sp. MAHUQ-63]MDD9270925.1 hypothetical protein [Paenibacillus sp. MAHUQ-63]
MRHVASLLIALTLAYAFTAEASAAAPMEVTAKLLERTMATATPSQASRIQALQQELSALQKVEQEWNAKILTQHNQNKEVYNVLSKRTKHIDEARLEQLEQEVMQIKERYKPLISRYTAINKQVEAARPLKSKGLNTLLKMQATALKIPVQLARADIRAKEKTYQTAKEAASQASIKLRGHIQEVTPINTQIKAKQSALTTIRRGLSPHWSAFKQNAKRADANGVQSSLSAMVTILRQINEEKQRIYKLETTVSDKLADIQQ